MRNAHLLERVINPPLHLRLRQAVVAGRKGNILIRCGHKKLAIAILKNVAYLFAY